MHDHFHTGIVSALFAGFSAIVLIHILRGTAAWLSDRPSTAGAGKVVGAFALAD